MPIRVLHIIKSLGRGGAETLLQETLRYHDKQAFEFHYIYFLPWKDQMAEGIEKEGGRVTNFPARNNWQIICAASGVADYVRAHDINIIHCHLPWAGFLGRRVFQKTGIPVIYTEHNKQERYHVATRILNKFSFNNQTAAIAVSADVAASIQKHIHPSIPVHTVLNGIDTHKFMRDENAGSALRKHYGIPADAIVLGNIAVFRVQKRLKEWVDVFASIEKKNPNIYGCLVGAGILFDEVSHHVNSLGLKNKILMPGIQSDVIPWLSVMDIFMMTSKFEGLPIALLEAMSMECTVVSTDAGGIKEVIRPGQDGFLCDTEEYHDITGLIQPFLNDSNELKKWSKKARIRVEDSFSIKSMVKNLEAIYFATITTC